MLPGVHCSGIKEVTGSVSKSGNLELGEEMVQYCYEPVQGDQVRRGIFECLSRKERGLVLVVSVHILPFFGGIFSNFQLFGVEGREYNESNIAGELCDQT